MPSRPCVLPSHGVRAAWRCSCSIAIIILNGGFGRGGASAVWSPIHGMIYFVYVISIANLGFKVGWSLPKTVVLSC